jgi:hypothetical protein
MNVIRTLRRSLALSLLALPAVAAADGAGTIDDANTSLTYTSPAYLFVNPLPFGAGAPEVGPFCEEGTPMCDTYRLTLNLSDEFRAEAADEYVTLDISVTFSDPNSDFDPYIFNPAGERMAGPSGSQGAPEFYSFVVDDALVNGEYLIQVMPWLALNVPFDMEITIVREDAKSGKGLVGGAPAAGLLLALAGMAALRRRRTA